MALLGRMARLLSADLNAVMDTLEEPDALLAQAIRDMEDEIADSRRQLRLARARIEDLDSRKKHLQRRIDKLNGELDLCFQSENDELARGLIRRKLQLERLAERTGAELDDATAHAEDDAARHESCEQTLVEMKEKAELVSTKTAQRPQGSLGDLFDEAISSDEIEAAMLREKQARRPA